MSKAEFANALAGYVTAVPTPFMEGRIDEAAFSRFCEWQVAQHVSGLVVAGPTGEASTLAAGERRRLVALAVEAARGFIPVVASVDSNATDVAIELARGAEEEGADGLLVSAPYYNRPTQDGVYRHFKAVLESVGLPILVNNAPSRTACAVAVPTMERLADLPRIAGLCDSSGDVSRPLRLRRILGDRLLLLGNDDGIALAFFAQGGDGCVSIVSNLVPRLCVRLHDAWREGSNLAAQAAALSLNRLTEALMLESDPGPLKYALSLLGRMSDELRLPLHPAGEATRREIGAAMAELGLPMSERSSCGSGGIAAATGEPARR